MTIFRIPKEMIHCLMTNGFDNPAIRGCHERRDDAPEGCEYYNRCQELAGCFESDFKIKKGDMIDVI